MNIHDSDGDEADTTGSYSHNLSNDETESEQGGGRNIFFADAILDLDDAHDLADDMDSEVDDMNLNVNMNDLIPSAASSLSSTSHSKFHSKKLTVNNEADGALTSDNQNAVTLEMKNLSKTISKDEKKNDSANSTSNSYHIAQIESDPNPITKSSLASKFRPKRPLHFRDRTYALAFFLFIPFTFYITHIFDLSFSTTQIKHVDMKNNSTEIDIVPHAPKNKFTKQSWTHAATSPQSSPFTHIPLILATILALFGSKYLYKIPGGGEGDHARHIIANLFHQSTILATTSHAILLFQIYILTPRAWMYCFLPLFWFLTDILIKRELCVLRNTSVASGEANSGSPSRFSIFLQQLFPYTILRSTASGVGSSDSEMAGQRGAWGSLLPGRRIFFSALLDVALDILSRSLRRAVFLRIIISTLLIQGFFLYKWITQFWKTLALDTMPLAKFLMVMLVVIGGWWMCCFLSRVLALIASGGIISWFANEKVILLETEKRQMESQHYDNNYNQSSNEAHSDSASDDFSVGYSSNNYLNNRNGYTYNLQDAYRTTDASAYSSVRDYDDGIEDDFEQEEEFGLKSNRGSSSLGSSGISSNETNWTTNTNVKAFLLSALTISVGSVIKDALLGTVAHYLHVYLRHIDGPNSQALLNEHEQAMRISTSMDNIHDSSSALYRFINKIHQILQNFHIFAHSFVKQYSEYGICHIAAYYKSHRKASTDVSSLLRICGVEPILHDDITSTMCSTLSSAITGWMSIFFFISLSHHRGGNTLADSDLIPFRLSDANICQIVSIQYIVCYLMISTLLEPLRASIQAVYVSYAQSPESMCHAFPLIFQRLRRISEGDVSNIF